jgi:hypothetical protein
MSRRLFDILETRYGKHAEEIARDMELDCE